ncbi:MAG: 30S ribosome-binding factor RbfA [Acidimicrobiia bacterium]|nr:30S ribosome-binding factor RbfA [Acidimicrobiia bacterium]
MKGPVRRPTRVGELIREQISTLMPELRDPRIGLATVTEVKMSPDLKHGRVYVSILGGPEERARTLAGLNSAASHLRHEIGARLRLRNTPDLAFFYDESIEYGARIEELIVQAKRSSEPD